MSRTYWTVVTTAFVLWIGVMVYLGIHNGTGACQP